MSKSRPKTETMMTTTDDERQKAKSKAEVTHADSVRAERLDHVLWLILDEKWEPGVTAPTLAAEWDLSIPTVERLAVEARSIARVAGKFAETAKRTADELGELRAQMADFVQRVAELEATTKGASARRFEDRIRSYAAKPTGG